MEDIKNFLKEFLNEDRKAGLLLFFGLIFFVFLYYNFSQNPGFSSYYCGHN